MAEYSISYGKAAVPVYRHGPDSLLAARVTVEVLGDEFLSSYTEGDNTIVVATDSIKNLVLRETGTWDGGTLESLLEHLGTVLLSDYPQMGAVRVSAEEIPFTPVAASGVLFARGPADHAVAELILGRGEAGPALRDVHGGRAGIELLKLTGSAFTAFVRDGYTTLPERRDRPLYVGMDVGWRYIDPADALGGDGGRYVDAAAVRDLLAEVFDDFVSESIQHLVHQMGTVALERLPSLAEISFEARNLTRDPVVEGVYTDPFPAFGTIHLTLRR